MLPFALYILAAAFTFLQAFRAFFLRTWGVPTDIFDTVGLLGSILIAAGACVTLFNLKRGAAIALAGAAGTWLFFLRAWIPLWFKHPTGIGAGQWLDAFGPLALTVLVTWHAAAALSRPADQGSTVLFPTRASPAVRGVLAFLLGLAVLAVLSVPLLLGRQDHRTYDMKWEVLSDGRVWPRVRFSFVQAPKWGFLVESYELPKLLAARKRNPVAVTFSVWGWPGEPTGYGWRSIETWTCQGGDFAGRIGTLGPVGKGAKSRPSRALPWGDIPYRPAGQPASMTLDGTGCRPGDVEDDP